jgi:3-hydroxybutyryl-CoA dehydrogenase
VYDLALDYATCPRLAIACADTCSPQAAAAAIGALQAAGIAVTRIDDVAGLIVMRTVAMLANEAADAVAQGIASARDIDLAMRNGVNYPRGPLAWADAIGVAHVCAVLRNLGLQYGPERYRIAPLLVRRCATGASIGA